MKRVFRSLSAALLSVPCGPVSAGDAFVAGENALPAESFGGTEGAVLLLLAMAAIVLFFGLLISAHRGHRRLTLTLDDLERRIAGKGSDR